jgi:hypothetical protein
LRERFLRLVQLSNTAEGLGLHYSAEYGDANAGAQVQDQVCILSRAFESKTADWRDQEVICGKNTQDDG